METLVENKKMFIYRTTNLVNGKIYVGQHKHDRDIYFGSGTYIKKALKKHGKVNFKREIICYCDTIGELDKQEEFYIKHYNATDLTIEYNFSDLAFDPKKMQKSPGQKKNHKQAVVDFANSEKGKANHERHSAFMLNRFKDEGVRKAHSDKIKASMSTPEAKARRSAQTSAFMKTEKGIAQKEKIRIGREKFENDPIKKKAKLDKMAMYRASEKGKMDSFNRIKSMQEANKLLTSYANETPIMKFSIDGEYLETYKSLREAGDKNNIKCIGNYKKHKKNFCGGFLWKKA